MTPLQKEGKFGVIDRLDQENVFVSAQRLDRPPHIGVWMDRKDDGDVRSQRDPRHGIANSREPAVEAFPAMARHQDQSPVAGMPGEKAGEYRLDAGAQLGMLLQQGRHPKQGVDPRIAGHDDPLVANTFAQQVVAGPSRRGEVKIGHMADEPAVHLLGPWRVDVVGAQAGLDMRHRNSVVEGRQCPGKGRGRVALHNDPVGSKGIEDPADTPQRRTRQISQVLVRPHDFEIPIRPEIEQVEDLRQ